MRSRRPTTVAQLPVVFNAALAAAAGIDRRAQARRVARGEWVRLRGGQFCTARTWEGASATGRHLLRAAAAQDSWDGSVVSHSSAAAARGWPVPLGDPGAPWLTIASAWTPGGAPAGAPRVSTARASTRRRPDVQIEVASLVSSEIERLRPSGLLVTGAARTVADCLRHLDARDAVAIADAAGQTVTREELLAVLTRQHDWPYAERALRSLGLVDPRRESWLESGSVVELDRGGVPVPEAQASIFDLDGNFIARVDQLWREHGIVGEVDGWAKYRSSGLASAADAERALRVEKVREDRVRDTGFEVVRAATREALTPGVYAARWRRARERADPGRVRARIISAPWPEGWR